MSDKKLGAYNIFDLRDIALRRVPKGLFEFVDRGTEDEVSLRNNRAVFERIRFKPRTLGRCVEAHSGDHALRPQTEYADLHRAYRHCGSHVARRRDCARACCTGSGHSFHARDRIDDRDGKSRGGGGGAAVVSALHVAGQIDVAQACRARERRGLRSARRHGGWAVSGNREYNLRNGFTIPFSFTRKNITDVMMHPRWLLGVLARYVMTTGMPRYENYPSEIKYKVTAAPMGRSQMKNDSLNWEDLKVLRKMWPGTLIVKGLAHPQDAVMAADCGADGVVVSNHGGAISMAPWRRWKHCRRSWMPWQAHHGSRRRRLPPRLRCRERRLLSVLNACSDRPRDFVWRGCGGHAGRGRDQVSFARRSAGSWRCWACAASRTRSRYLHFTDNGFRRAAQTRADLKLLDTGASGSRRLRRVTFVYLLCCCSRFWRWVYLIWDYRRRTQSGTRPARTVCTTSSASTTHPT